MNARDRRTFDFIESQMRRFADMWGLPFKGLLTMHRQKFAKNLYGICHPDGRIAIRIRWDTGKPLQTYAIIDTMAHELAHLKYLTHSRNWFQLHASILATMSATNLLDRLNRRMNTKP